MTIDTLSRPEKIANPIKRVAILFAGGPAPAANAVISSAAVSFIRNGAEVIGIKHGYSTLMEYDGETPLVEGQDYILLTEASLDQTRAKPGIMIGTARANPGKSIQQPSDFQDADKTAALQRTYNAMRSLDVDAFISIGGDDTLKTANKFQLFQKHLGDDQVTIPVVHLPKTIDNDYT